MITICPSCQAALSKHFAELLAGDAAWRQRAEAVAARAHDFSSFAAARAGPGAGGDLRLTYHDSCHLKRGAGVCEEPRRLLRAAGYQVVEMDNADACCGFAGSYSFDYPAISARILEEKLRSVEATGAPLVATDCPGCILQLRGGLHKRGSKVRVCHTAELLAGDWESPRDQRHETSLRRRHARRRAALWPCSAALPTPAAVRARQNPSWSGT